MDEWIVLLTFSSVVATDAAALTKKNVSWKWVVVVVVVVRKRRNNPTATVLLSDLFLFVLFVVAIRIIFRTC
jgi:hypothetical protein